MQRPLYPYPQLATHDGDGDAGLAQSFLNKLCSLLRPKAELRSSNRHQVLDFTPVKYFVCERNIKHKNGRCLTDRAGTPICVAWSRLRRRRGATI
jgi:hypothetical protein